MNAIYHEPEMRKFRAKAAVVQTAVLLAVVVGLGVIGATTPDHQLVSMNCAFDPGGSGTVSDATMQLAGACGNGTPAEADTAPVTAKYGVPDASASLDPRTRPEPLPPTF